MNINILTPLKIFFTLSSRIAPFIAVRLTNKLFTTPFHSKRRDIEHEMLESAERFIIPMGKDIKLAGYRWGKEADPIILLVHGWTATATCFVNFIDPLLERGYQVISYDAIAHGETSGVSVSLTEWADTVLSVMEYVGKVYCIMGHSLGAGAIVIASSLKLETDKIVLISPVSDLSKVTDQFAAALSIPKHIMEKTHQYAWKKYYTSASKYGDNWDEVFNSTFKVPTLLIHDINDKEIDIINSRELVERWTWAEFMETKRLGHRRILLNPDVITRVLGFISEDNSSHNHNKKANNGFNLTG
ncbi:MAG: alpha/beta hydrolase [Candidatus Thiodiazotropha sp. LLP2]